MDRLNLPGKVLENGEESASYDVEKGSTYLRAKKFFASNFLTQTTTPP